MSERKLWTLFEAKELFDQPLLELIFAAQRVHRQHFYPSEIQVSSLLSIKTGACPEDCKYCPQSARHKTGLENAPLMPLEQVLMAAREAKAAGSTRFCMGAAWSRPHQRDMLHLEKMIIEVKALGLETCMTLGMLNIEQSQRLSKAGLDYYNHNLDTSPEFYPSIISTRSYQDRLDTLENVRMAGIKVCCGGIVGLGETAVDRASLLVQLANLPEPPESVPINMLVRVKGTPLENNAGIDAFDIIRTVAVARLMISGAYIRLSAGREQMNEQTQALCFMAGVNSIFYGNKLLTTPNSSEDKDRRLFTKLGLKRQQSIIEPASFQTTCSFRQNESIDIAVISCDTGP